MGTSKRSMNDKVKEMLKTENESTQSPLEDQLKDIVPVVITEKKLHEYIEINDIEEKFDSTKHFLSSISSGGFKGKTLSEIKEDPATIEDLKNELLEKIDSDEDLSETLEKAVRYTFTLLIDEENLDINTFIKLFFQKLIYYILEKNILENAKESYSEMSYEDIREELSRMTNQIFDSNLNESIDKYVDRKISLDEILKEIVVKAKGGRQGEF